MYPNHKGKLFRAKERCRGAPSVGSSGKAAIPSNLFIETLLELRRNSFCFWKKLQHFSGPSALGSSGLQPAILESAAEGGKKEDSAAFFHLFLVNNPLAGTVHGAERNTNRHCNIKPAPNSPFPLSGSRLRRWPNPTPKLKGLALSGTAENQMSLEQPHSRSLERLIVANKWNHLLARSND